MARNIYSEKRVAFASSLTLLSSNSTIYSTGSNVYIPKGAIITGVKLFGNSLITVTSNLANCTFNVYVGGLAVGSNNNIITSKILNTAGADLALASGAVYVSAGGNIILYIGSATSTASGIGGGVDLYVEYLYCADGAGS